MVQLETALQIFRTHQADLNQRGVKSLAVFGSVARDENTPASDLDVLVKFDHLVGLFEFIRLKYYLESLVNCRVDLVIPDAIRPEMRENILKEAVYFA